MSVLMLGTIISISLYFLIILLIKKKAILLIAFILAVFSFFMFLFPSEEWARLEPKNKEILEAAFYNIPALSVLLFIHAINIKI
ncbi:hypothetical protein [Marinobacterium stanieri]|uniref:hypothetical protein n=1 Tax=Marinobacterium stanieri TaxID=49186 RepID=UPI003A95099C